MKLEVGTVKIDPEPRKKLVRSSRLSSGGSSNGGGKNRGGGNDGGGGGDSPRNSPFDAREEIFTPDKSRFVMWFLLLVVVMTFGGLMSAYIVIATNGVIEWKPFNLPFQVYISTVLILSSSITYHFSNSKLKNDEQTAARKWLLATTVLGAAFISSQMLVWLELARRGVYVSSNPYAGFFYILTAVHAFHVLGGIAALGYIVLRTRRETLNDNELMHRQTFSNVIGWYWHFMDGLWILLILLLGFWK
ncbi:MAG: cytochrome c oxidase subunit 3 [Pyrinomonadaceae bacterium]